MRISKEKAAQNHELILTQAARLFREKGVVGVGVDELTEAAGLTHGSLYSRFGSKDHLLAECLRHGHAASQSRAADVKSLIHAIAMYLSPAHRDNPGSGCFMAALGCDMPRQSKEVRASFTQIVRNNIARLAGLLPAGRKGHSENQAIAIMATLVGALVLARAVDDSALSERILSAARTQLLQIEKQGSKQ